MKKYIRSWVNSMPWIINSVVKIIPSRTLRLLIYRCLGAQIAKHVSMFSNVDVRCPSRLIIGEGCSIGPRVLLDARRNITIGRNVTVAYDSIIWTLHHDMNSENFRTIGGSVTIGDYAWICSRSIILPGVTIGKYAVIASGSVVTKDVEPFSIIAGVPGKIIGYRDQREYTYVPYYNIHCV